MVKILNTQAGQYWKVSDDCYVLLHKPVTIKKEGVVGSFTRNSYIYDTDGSFDVWFVEWFEYRRGKLTSDTCFQMRMDNKYYKLVSELPGDKIFYMRNNPLVTGSGCDGHRYSSQEIVLTNTDEVIGIFSWEEWKGCWMRVGDQIFDLPEKKKDYTPIIEFELLSIA